MGVLGTTIMQLAFFPGVMLSLQWPFIESYPWFIITLLLCASISDGLGKLVAKVFVSRKHCFLPISLARNISFTMMCMLTLWGIMPVVFKASWYLVFALFWFASTFGYLLTVGAKHGTDDTVSHKPTAGKLIGLHASIGMAIGSTLGLILLS